MNKTLLYIVAAAAAGGFLFGFDSGVISGCEKAIQSEFSLSAFWHGLVISGALVGTIAGVAAAGRPCDRLGRKPVFWTAAVLFMVSAAGCALAPFDTTTGACVLGVARFVGGLAIGAVAVVVPLYVVEISPGNLRGRLVAMHQLNVVLGILVSYVSNYFVARLMPGVDPRIVWRVMLGVECLPAALFMVLLATIPESPRWLVRAGRADEAGVVLSRIGHPSVQRALAEIAESLRAAAGGADVPLFQRRYLRPVALAVAIAFFNQASGINAINYYAPRIFQMIFGDGSGLAALAGTMGVGAVNLLFTMLAFPVIDRFGRRPLLLCGSAAMAAMHGLVAWQLSLPSPDAAVAVAGILGFIACFAVSSGAVFSVFMSEVFPNAVRAKGLALGGFTHWTLCTAVSWAFPAVAEKAGSAAFMFFAAMMALEFAWALFFMPETKGGSIEDLEKRLASRPE